MKKKGFTLIELLVVISIIALLMAIMMPSLGMIKKKATAAACLSNVRQLSIGWFMYQEENQGKLVSCRMADLGTMTSDPYEAWIVQPHTADDTTSSSLSLFGMTPQVTDEDEIRGIKKGVLYPYLGSADVYHCPGDKLRQGCDGTKMFVSYAIPYCLNVPGNSDTIKRFTSIRRPSKKFNFVETGTYGSRNWTWRGWWTMAVPSSRSEPAGLHDPLAISHGNSGVFGFVDGHAEVHKWHDSIVLDHYAKGDTMRPGDTYGTTYPEDGTTSADIEWLAEGWAGRR